MNESKHTPGPWKYFQPVSGTGIMYEITRFPYVNHCIGEAHSEADARLIAAAPDMLEALKNIENDDKHMPETAWNLIQAAIAKAQGTEA